MYHRKHELKTWTEYYQAICSGEKTFELRLNDRDFKKGDILILQEFDPFKNELTDRWIEKQVSYILFGPKFGLTEGYCIMSLA